MGIPRRRMPSIESNQLLLAAAAACEDKKAEDIRILALDPAESGLTDYFLICNGTNDRQNVAITDEIEIRLKREFGVYPNSVEGRRQGEWILMDYVDFIVHVFSQEKRAFYGLERLRKTATTISVADLNAEVSARITASRAKAPKKTVAAKAATKVAVKKAVPGKSAAKKVAIKSAAPAKAAKKISGKKSVVGKKS
jgi:ribosome-associated protein